jgi:flagellar biosynthesis/type III secretory pathway chaperone
MEHENQKNTYMALLEASLTKKSNILDHLIVLSKEQEIEISRETMDEDHFEGIFQKKDELIETILKLDDGFEQVYQRVKEELNSHPGSYQKEIGRLTSLITEITDKGVSLQAIELRNKSNLEMYLQRKRKVIRDSKVSMKSANNYYKNMANQNQQQSYFFDKKK